MGSMKKIQEETMITIGELSPEVKARVVTLLDSDAIRGVMNAKTLRVVATGLAFQNLNKKYNGVFGNGIKKGTSSLLTNEQVLELDADRQENFVEYLTLARDIYTEAIISDSFTELLKTTSSPDATGNDLDIEAAADNVVPGTQASTSDVCPICNTVHED